MRIRQLIAAVVMVAVMSSTAEAQRSGMPLTTPAPAAEKTAHTRPCFRPDRVSIDAWNRMSADEQNVLCASEPPRPLITGHEYYPTKQLSVPLTIVGVVSILAGIGMITGGGTTYHILGDDFCVSDYSVNSGSCFDPDVAKIGLIAVGAGALMTWIGTRRVFIKPQISTHHKAVSATLRW